MPLATFACHRFPPDVIRLMTSPRSFVVIQSWSDAPPTTIPTSPSVNAIALPEHRHRGSGPCSIRRVPPHGGLLANPAAGGWESENLGT
jgi:hypothetical protein